MGEGIFLPYPAISPINCTYTPWKEVLKHETLLKVPKTLIKITLSRKYKVSNNPILVSSLHLKSVEE